MSSAGAFGAATYLVALSSAAVLTGAALSRWTESDALDRALAATIGTFGVLIGTALVLGMTGLLYRETYLGTVLLLGTVSAGWLLRKGRTDVRVPAAWTIGGAASLGIGGILASLAALPTVRAMRVLEPETRLYHLSNLVWWAREGSIWELPYASAGYFTATQPGGGELLAVGPLFATGGDHLVFTTTILFGGLGVIAAATVARELGGRPELGALAALALIATPGVFATQSHSLAVDLASASGLLAGVAALVRAHRERDARWALAAGAALGLGVGASYNVLLPASLVVAASVVTLRPRRHVVWLAPGLLLFAGPWLLRNAVSTGNPIFPQGLRIGGREVFAAGESPLTELSTTMLDHVMAGRIQPLDRWVRIALELFGPALFLIAAGVVAALAIRDRSPRRLAVTALAVSTAAIYTVTPYVGGGPEGQILRIASGQRHLIPALLVGVALAAAVLPRRLLVVLVAATFVFSAYWRVEGYGFRPDLRVPVVGIVLAAVAGVILTAAVLLFGRRRFRNPAGLAVAAVIAILPLAAIVARVDGSVPRSQITEAVAATGAKEVVVLGVTDTYGLLGPDLDVRLRTITAGGAAAERPIGDPAALDQALAQVDVDILAVQHGSPTVPAGWEPQPPWRLARSTPQGDVYVRES